MTYKTSLTTLVLSAALLSAPGLASLAYAHDGGDHQGSAMHCGHHHLSQDKISLLRATFKKFHEDNKGVFEELHKLHKERHDILAAKTFNKEAFLSVSARIEEKHEQLAKARIQAFASIADKFTPEERERLGRKLGHHHRHHHHGGWKHHEWKQGEGHEGWHHHDGETGDKNSQDQASPASDQEDAAPASAQ